MEDKQEFDLTADPFNTGFEVNPHIDTDCVIQWLADRDSFIPKEGRPVDPVWWKANAKAAIKNGWFTAPNWKPNDVNKWPLGQTRWLSDWTQAKYLEMSTVPFGD